MTGGPDVASGASDSGFLAGAIEGFYGRPWSAPERVELFDWMAAFGLNTYLYAPKDDLTQRALWRQRYSPEEAAALASTIRDGGARGLRFIYALSPGLDIRFGSDEDQACLRARFEQMLGLGCENFALLFDDIPDRMHEEDAKRWASFASAQCDATNGVYRWVRGQRPGARFLFCPTPYCGRMADRQLGGPGYLDTVGRELDAGIDVCWTGPEIVSREIPVAHIRDLRQVIRRKPLIWDNLHANDYDGRRMYCGPYAGRPDALRQEVAGILSNPNSELPLNYVPLRTLGEFVRGRGPWDARRAYLEAMGAWLPRFETVDRPIPLDDLLLLGDCCYLPHEEGPLAEALLASARRLLASDPATRGDEAAFTQQAARLRDVCARVSELRDRPLFYALSRRTWDLREEMDLLLACVRSKKADPGAPCRSDFHLPGTYRGGMVARLQRLLAQREDGAFLPAADTDSPRPGPTRQSEP
jgi:protein O-GlcNAcase/histone acetyltransferase